MTPKQIISILQSQVGAAEQENNGLRATRDDLAKALKEITECVWYSEDQCAELAVEMQKIASAALAAQSGINPKS